VGSLDAGTSSVRFALVAKNGEMPFIHQKEFQQILPQPGYVEHDPLVIMKTVEDCMAAVMHKSGLQPSDIRAIGITNQR
jgi:glycerol kinase